MMFLTSRPTLQTKWKTSRENVLINLCNLNSKTLISDLNQMMQQGENCPINGSFLFQTYYSLISYEKEITRNYANQFAEKI